MDKIKVRIKKLRENAVIPEYKTPGSAACDLVSCEDVLIPARGRAMVPTGISVEADGVAVLLFARSGLAVRHGIALANGVGVVDSDYRGEIVVGLINNTGDAYRVKAGERVAQMMFVPVVTAEFEEADALSETERGDGGFGSTGKQG
ncbi:MAG: dUTP diphosphatase [Ruminococcaceae bacterium]|nr:dUTP diphosphatase [Oscillospiraceae bacterium]